MKWFTEAVERLRCWALSTILRFGETELSTKLLSFLSKKTAMYHFKRKKEINIVNNVHCDVLIAYAFLFVSMILKMYNWYVIDIEMLEMLFQESFKI